MSDEMAFIQELIAVGFQKGQQAWKTVLFSVVAVRGLAVLVDADTTKHVLKAGLTYSGCG